MKICIVTPSFKGGGAEKIAVNLSNHYARSGHIVTLVVAKCVGPYMEQVDPAVKVLDLRASRVRYALWRLFGVLRSERSDVVLSVIRDTNIIAGLAGIFLPAQRLVFREANTMDLVSQMRFPKKWLWLLLLRVAYLRANKIIANSDGTRADLISHGVVKRSKIVVYGNPVLPANFEELVAAPATHPWIKDKNIKVLLNVGRLHKQKNQKMLISAFSEVLKEFSDVRLLIVGEGEERENLIKFCEEKQLDGYIEIIDFQLNPYPFYKGSDLFVLTSSWEGFGNVLVEAMACGVPVISTDCPGGPKSILENGKLGKLVPVDDPRELAALLKREIRSEVDVVRMDWARGRAKEFSVEAIASQYLQIMQNAT